ncbi:hypothetical protein HK405_011564 [Cladochytrium tenue]|nr:hypothetical protein HK405_011564 [Cladochytrium tenue]
MERVYWERYLPVLNKGLVLAGRKFDFLAFSSSSLRENSVIFFAGARVRKDGELQTIDANHIRAWMGDFSHIRCAARYAARMGQAFTSTTATVEIAPEELEMHVPDIERNGFCFSDGIGTISLELAESMWVQYQGRRRRNPVYDDDGEDQAMFASMPHAFQIRFGGAKGMISVDPRLKGRKLRIRSSMIKFESNSMNLEIAADSRVAREAYLNRQIITILEDLGVPPRIFLELQSEHLKKIQSAQTDSKTLLELLPGGRFSSFVREAVKWIDFSKLTKSNAFLAACEEHILLYLLKEIKFRARLKVPGGWTLLGVLDETGTLNEGEVYVNVELPFDPIRAAEGGSDEECRTKELSGRVLVFRSPCLHPGDVQLATAVRVPALAHLKNCVVFSNKGARDLPSQLAGGDLDGDLFSVVTTTDYFPRERHEPARYAKQRPVELDRDVTVADITRFVVDFFINNKVGIIATRHLSLADSSVGGSKHPDCLTLAEMHSTAVDFPKTGIVVNMSNAPKVQSRPDFKKKDLIYQELSQERQPPQDGRPKRFYRSKRVMGTMFRDPTLNAMIKQEARRVFFGNQDLEIGLSKLTLTPRGGGGGDAIWDFLRRMVTGWTDHVQVARELHWRFDADLRSILLMTEPRLSEVDLWTEFIVTRDAGRLAACSRFDRERHAKNQFDGLVRKLADAVREHAADVARGNDETDGSPVAGVRRDEDAAFVRRRAAVAAATATAMFYVSNVEVRRTMPTGAGATGVASGVGQSRVFGFVMLPFVFRHCARTLGAPPRQPSR